MKEGIEKSLFRPADARVVGVFRGLLACFLLFAFWPRGLEPLRVPWGLEAWQGVYLSGFYRGVVFAGILVFGLGWKPRLVGPILVLLLVPHDFLDRGRQSRQVLIFVLFFVSLMPGWPLWKWRFHRKKELPEGPMWPLRLVQLQLSVLYGVNVYKKLTPEFLSGEVLSRLSAQPNFLVDLRSGVWEVGGLEVPVSLLAVGTVVAEALLAAGFWFRSTRVATAIFGVCFHLLLMFVISIFMLGYTSLFLYLAFLLPFEKKGELEIVDGK